MSSSQKKVLHCPICNAEVEPRSTNRFFPFCSARCRQVDLGRWLNEEYRVAVREETSARELASTLNEDV
ncbi:MAG: DNA gyrase inhibitor YacG [Myxococcota bacterium]